MDRIGNSSSTSFMALQPEELQSMPEIGDLVGYSAVTVLRLYRIFEQRAPYFHFALNPTHDVATPAGGCRLHTVDQVEKVFSS